MEPELEALRAQEHPILVEVLDALGRDAEGKIVLLAGLEPLARKIKLVTEEAEIGRLVTSLILLAHELDTQQRSREAAIRVVELAAVAEPALTRVIGESVDWTEAKKVAEKLKSDPANDPARGLAAKNGGFGVSLRKTR